MHTQVTPLAIWSNEEILTWLEIDDVQKNLGEFEVQKTLLQFEFDFWKKKDKHEKKMRRFQCPKTKN